MGAIGCGGDMPGAKTVDAEAPAEPAAVEGDGDSGGADEPESMEGEAAAFSKEEQQLRQLFGVAGTTTGGLPQPTRASESGEDLSKLDDGQRCTRACKALASMKRSADSFCEMTGEDDPRCKNLRERVESARTLVAERCPSCNAAKP